MVSDSGKSSAGPRRRDHHPNDAQAVALAGDGDDGARPVFVLPDVGVVELRVDLDRHALARNFVLSPKEDRGQVFGDAAGVGRPYPALRSTTTVTFSSGKREMKVAKPLMLPLWLTTLRWSCERICNP